MLFNSINFAIFLPIVFFTYWLVSSKNRLLSNGILLFSSYLFYSFWDWKFLSLLLFSTFIDYLSGIKIYQSNNETIKRTWFCMSITLNILILGVFKYYDFFASSLIFALSNIGFHLDLVLINLILPVGISFYTFHGLSYIIDVYNNKIKPEKNIVDYALFVSFFPLLVAGPIERATHLLPQIKQNRVFEYNTVADGLRQILWGLFKKIVIADQCAFFANMIFNNSSQYNGSTHLIGAVFFAFQIYGDFSGYSDIALGSAKLFGINLLRNFNYPYFSRDISEFWRRWHISLSSWFKDYLYIPLGGSKGSTWTKIRNVFIIFIVSGLWHGAKWNFVIWGLLNAVFILPSIITKKNRTHIEIVAKGKPLPTLNEFISIIITFSITVFAWIFFRSDSVSHAINFISCLFSSSLFSMPEFELMDKAFITFLFVFFLLIIEWINREHLHIFTNISNKYNKATRWFIYCLMIFVMGMYMRTEETPFIYFQF